MTNDRSSVRTAATRLLDVLDRVGDDVGAAEGEIEAIMKELLLVEWLDDVDATPAGNDADDDVSTGWLYQDSDLRIVRGRMRAGFVQEPHDHGAWNIFAVYRGACQYRWYRRIDDGSCPYRADLELAENRVMTDGDVTVLPAPPHDIHAVTASGRARPHCSWPGDRSADTSGVRARARRVQGAARVRGCEVTPQTTGELEGRIAIVTGGASGNRPRDRVRHGGRRCRSRGRGRDEDAAAVLAEHITGGGGVAMPVTVDVSDEAQVASMVEAVTAAWGSVSILANVAAVDRPRPSAADGSVGDAQVSIWERTLAVDLIGSMLTAKHVVPVMANAGRGAVVNVSSTRPCSATPR